MRLVMSCSSLTQPLYYVTAMALNTGWPNPTSVGDDGTTFHNADETLLLLGADIEEGTTFVIPKPAGA